MKYIALLTTLTMALINIPFFPNTINVFACGFSAGIFAAMLINSLSRIRVDEETK